MTGRSPTAIHHERKARATLEALKAWVREKNKREKAAKRAARQEQPHAGQQNAG